jgi:hypothetical protein
MPYSTAGVKSMLTDWCWPGFIDIHTQFDAQISWDPLLTSCRHGITTVLVVIAELVWRLADLRKGP